MKRAVLSAVAILILGGCGGGSELEIDNGRVWVPAGSTTAAYFDVINSGAVSDVLVGVDADVADASVHETVTDDGIIKMKPAAEVEIAAGETVRFEPGGLHVMLVDVAPLSVGDVIELRLRFEKSGTIRVQVPVTEIEIP